ncbi:MAG: tripartite tricarboxylate transporter TctB family protein [Spirochaetales bacterium]|nr:tripartite tricarboxylate transporter TctB family protein [Spirochaetales bacterium]
MRRFKDIVVGAIVMAFGVFYFSQTLSIKKIPYIDPVVGSAMFPRIIAGVIFVCGLAILLQGIRIAVKAEDKSRGSAKTIMEEADEAENGAPEKADKKKGNIKVVLVLLSFALYAFFMDKIGFAVASGLYMFSQMILMDSKRPTAKRMVFYAVLSAVLSAAVFALFRYGFGLILPKARWF